MIKYDARIDGYYDDRVSWIVTEYKLKFELKTVTKLQSSFDQPKTQQQLHCNNLINELPCSMSTLSRDKLQLSTLYPSCRHKISF